MVDSIGRAAVGRSAMIRGKGTNLLRDKIQKMEQWRDKARINILRQRERYKQKVETNRALMRAKKAGGTPNLNPSAVTFGDRAKSVQYGATHSTVPLKPVYSIVKPAERIYGNKWKKLEEGVKHDRIDA